MRALMSDRPFLYLLPGLLCDDFVFAEEVRALADRATLRVPNFFGLDSLATMAERVLAEAPCRFALAGFSMGGRVALQIVRQAAHRVERLALLDTGAEGCQAGEKIARQKLVDLGFAQGMAALAGRWLPPMLHPRRHTDPAIVGPLTAMVCRATPAVFEAQVHALLGRPDATEVLAAIDCPTLVACGRQDEFTPLSQHEAMAGAIKGATLEIFEDAGHFAPVETPSAVSEALRRWLDRPSA
jgi:pimeloyl-ACP methyl ester carboxylesterase